MTETSLSEGDHFFSTDDITLHYRVGGSGPIIVATSVGWGLPGCYLWNTLGPELEKHHLVIYLEPRGNGKSSHPHDDSTMASRDMVDDIESLRKHLGLDVIPALLGHSNGACIALGFAEKNPDRLEKLILIDAEIHDGPPSTNYQGWASKRRDLPEYSAAYQSMQAPLVRAWKFTPDG